MLSRALVSLLLATALALPTAAHATGPALGLGLIPTYDDPYAPYTWEGDWQSRTVTFSSAATGAQLSGTVFAPKTLPADPVPAVVIAPGSGPGVEAMYQWAARDLAGHGYVAVTVDPQGVGKSDTFGAQPCGVPAATDPTSACPGVPFQQSANYVDAVESGVDFLISTGNPFLAVVDPAHIGAAGHSLSARAVSYAQSIDPRIKAIVAWDNLASDLSGDAGSASGGGTAGQLIGGEVPGASHPVTPRVPALGEANDHVGSTTPTAKDPDVKKTAYALWRAAGQPTMELVFKGTSHLDWSQSNATTSDANLQHFAYYTRAWFDRYLRDDKTATSRLMAPVVNGTPLASILSTQFHSAASLDEVHCEDLLACTATSG